MTLMLVMNLGFAGGGSAPTFQAAWAKGANIVIQQRPTP